MSVTHHRASPNGKGVKKIHAVDETSHAVEESYHGIYVLFHGCQRARGVEAGEMLADGVHVAE